jgi:alkylation response protein AidB-like acyl-CoA dehydrogenase
MTPEDRLPPSILEGAERVGIRTLGVPEEFGGVELDKGTEVSTFALIAEEIARGDSGLSDGRLAARPCDWRGIMEWIGFGAFAAVFLEA